MQRAANYMWCDAKSRADFGLHGAGSLLRAHSQADELCVASFDESNAFSYRKVPRELALCQSGPAVRASELPADWIDGRWPGDTILRPCYGRLATPHSPLTARVADPPPRSNKKMSSASIRGVERSSVAMVIIGRNKKVIIIDKG